MISLPTLYKLGLVIRYLENLTLLHGNKKGADQPVHMIVQSVSTFVDPQDMMAKLVRCKMLGLQLVSVAKQAGLSMI